MRKKLSKKKRIIILFSSILFTIVIIIVVNPNIAKACYKKVKLNFLSLNPNQINSKKINIKFLKEQRNNINIFRKIIKNLYLKYKKISRYYRPYQFNYELNQTKHKRLIYLKRAKTLKEIPLDMRTMNLYKLNKKNKIDVDVDFKTLLLSFTYDLAYNYFTQGDLLKRSDPEQFTLPMTLEKLNKKRNEILKSTIQKITFLYRDESVKLLDPIIFVPYQCPVKVLSNQKIIYSYPLSFLVTLKNLKNKQFDICDYSVLDNSKLIEEIFRNKYLI